MPGQRVDTVTHMKRQEKQYLQKSLWSQESLLQVLEAKLSQDKHLERHM